MPGPASGTSTHTHFVEHRLNRDYVGRIGSGAYAFEALVAELGAASVCGQLVLAVGPRPEITPVTVARAYR